jgi:hypothetical protein
MYTQHPFNFFLLNHVKKRTLPGRLLRKAKTTIPTDPHRVRSFRCVVNNWQVFCGRPAIIQALFAWLKETMSGLAINASEQVVVSGHCGFNASIRSFWPPG